MGKQAGVDELFEGRHFDREVIILCVRWYLRFKLSLRDLLEMMAERGLSLAHTTHARCRLWHRPVSPSRTTSTDRERYQRLRALGWHRCRHKRDGE